MADKKTDDGNGQSQVVLETRPRTKKPSMYKVIMLNDDYTPCLLYTSDAADEA